MAQDLSGQLETVKRELLEAFGELKREIATRFDAADRRFDAVDAATHEMDGKIQYLCDRFLTELEHRELRASAGR